MAILVHSSYYEEHGHTGYTTAPLVTNNTFLEPVDVPDTAYEIEEYGYYAPISTDSSGKTEPWTASTYNKYSVFTPRYDYGQHVLLPLETWADVGIYQPTYAYIEWWETYKGLESTTTFTGNWNLDITSYSWVSNNTPIGTPASAALTYTGSTHGQYVNTANSYVAVQASTVQADDRIIPFIRAHETGYTPESKLPNRSIRSEFHATIDFNDSYKMAIVQAWLPGMGSPYYSAYGMYPGFFTQYKLTKV